MEKEEKRMLKKKKQRVRITRITQQHKHSALRAETITSSQRAVQSLTRAPCFSPFCCLFLCSDWRVLRAPQEEDQKRQDALLLDSSPPPKSDQSVTHSLLSRQRLRRHTNRCALMYSGASLILRCV